MYRERLDMKTRQTLFAAVMLLAVDAAFSVRGEAPLLPALVPAPRVMALSEGTCSGGMKPKVERDAALPAEGYELTVAADGVTIRAADAAGEFYAWTTLEQLAEIDVLSIRSTAQEGRKP